MKRAFRNIAALTWAGLALGFSTLWAQKPKSQKEQQAILAVQMAKTPDDRVAAIEKVLTDFADTEYKVALLQMAMQTEQQKNDFAQTVFYADRLLKADPKNAFALVTLASETARHTRENDLDKDDQLAKVDKWAKEGIEASKTLAKIRPDIADADWEGVKKDMQSQGFVALGMAEVLKKNYDGAAADYRQSIEVGSSPNPATLVRLAQVYMASGKLDNANFTLDKAINTPDVPAQIKQIAENMKADIAKRKPAGSAPPAGAAAPSSSATPASATPGASTAPPAAKQP
jgi:tetratricopeptide (TPR) repeat protein